MNNPSSLQFTKMHGLGNDFVIIHPKQKFDYSQLPIQQLANRHLGIGFDQLLILETTPDKKFFCRIFNSDGSEAEQCGNGLRCVARYIHENGLHADSSFVISTNAGGFPVSIKDYEHITVSLDAPIIQKNLVNVKINNDSFPISILSTGNPHAIIKVDSIEQINASQIAPKIAALDYFSAGANVGFMEIMNDSQVRLKTFERGAGETHACGSNACAAAVSGIVNGWLKPKVTIHYQYGALTVEWKGANHPIQMTGSATRVFDGEFVIPA